MHILQGPFSVKWYNKQKLKKFFGNFCDLFTLDIFIVQQCILYLQNQTSVLYNTVFVNSYDPIQ